MFLGRHNNTHHVTHMNHCSVKYKDLKTHSVDYIVVQIEVELQHDDAKIIRPDRFSVFSLSMLQMKQHS